MPYLMVSRQIAKLWSRITAAGTNKQPGVQTDRQGRRRTDEQTNVKETRAAAFRLSASFRSSQCSFHLTFPSTQFASLTAPLSFPPSSPIPTPCDSRVHTARDVDPKWI